MKEWFDYCEWKFPDKEPKPEDIPTDPERIYNKNGWVGARDWLRHDSKNTKKKKIKNIFKR